MTAFVHILAATPTGPYAIETDATLLGRRAMHSEALDGSDAEVVAAAARKLLMPAMVLPGWFAVPGSAAKRMLDQAKASQEAKRIVAAVHAEASQSTLLC